MNRPRRMGESPYRQEIEVGILTALIGAPFFIWIVRRQKVREL